MDRVDLAVGDGVKLFSDLVGKDNAVLGGGQGMGGGQGINGKHPVDVIQNYQVFLGWGRERESERARERLGSIAADCLFTPTLFNLYLPPNTCHFTLTQNPMPRESLKEAVIHSVAQTRGLPCFA